MDFAKSHRVDEDDTVALSAVGRSHLETLHDKKKKEERKFKILVALLAASLVIAIISFVCLILVIQNKHDVCNQANDNTDASKAQEINRTCHCTDTNDNVGGRAEDACFTKEKGSRCHIQYEGKCFWGIFGGEGTTDLKQANFYCSQFGAYLAYVYSRAHYKMISTYVHDSQVELDPDGLMGIWTGMVVNTTNRKVSYMNGSLAPHLEDPGLWISGYPLNGLLAATNIVMGITRNFAPPYHGIRTGDPNDKIYGVLCEY